jgi:hypothetical protein
LADSAREQGEPVVFEQRGADESAILESGALTAAATLERSLRGWPTPSAADKAALAETHLSAARTLLAAGDAAGAQDELNQSIALDPTRGETYLLLGEALQSIDVQASTRAFRRAAELSARDGATLEKIAIAYANRPHPTGRALSMRAPKRWRRAPIRWRCVWLWPPRSSVGPVCFAAPSARVKPKKPKPTRAATSSAHWNSRPATQQRSAFW